MYAFLFEDGNAKRGVAQLVARSVRDAEVVGSIPVASTKNTVKPYGCTVFFRHLRWLLHETMYYNGFA